MTRALALLAALCLPACVGTTGSDLFEFDAYAAGPEDGAGAGPFVTSRGYTVTLERATLHVGAVYLNRTVPVSVSSDTTCVLAGVYVAEVPSGLDVDLLSPEPSRFPTRGDASEERARTGEVWLMGGSIDDTADPTPILDLAGTAEKDGQVIPFEGTLTIGANRVVPPSSPALPGQNPICKQRVVSPIPADLTLRRGGSLLLRADPRGLFRNVDFATLAPAATRGGPRRFDDGDGDQASVNLYAGLRAASGTYTFDWLPEGPP